MATEPTAREPALLYIWLDSDPAAMPADVTIEDIAGVSDLELVSTAVKAGRLGRYLPVTIRFSDHPTPVPNRVRAIDTARLLREHHIRHRRRYEVIG